MSEHAKPIPSHLAQRYHGWRATQYEENAGWYQHLATHGQNPRTMVVSCCDSRLTVTSMFGVDSGEIFIHRNIANLVPPYADDDALHGTSAAVEYGVNFLNVANLMVIGHSQCGGVSGAFDMFEGAKISDGKFLVPWLGLLREGYDRCKSKAHEPEHAKLIMEREAVVTSLENLMTFPFVAERVANGRLAIHGLWHDIATGKLHQYDAKQKEFVAV